MSDWREDHIQDLIRWTDDPVSFCRDIFAVELDEWQIDALNALPTKDRVAFIASKGVGKSFLEAMAGWWWMVTRKNAEVICTSTSADNLRDGLWKEIGKWYAQSPFLQSIFEFNSERVVAKENRINWYMAARSWRKTADPVEQAQVLAGIHGDHMLYLGDEAGDSPAAVIASAEAMLANVDQAAGREAKLLLGGNPTDPNGPLYIISTRNRHLWHVVNINGDPDNPKRSPRVSVKWARDQIEQHGADNPWVLVSVFGKFPPTGFMNLLGPDEVLAAMGRIAKHDSYAFAQKRMGVDVARYGDDRTVLFIRQGLQSGPFAVERNLDTQQVAARAMVAMQRQEPEVVYVDSDGLGAGVVDAMNVNGAHATGVSSSGKTDESKYYNKRAEVWFRLQNWVRRGGCLPKSDELLRELTAPTYTLKGGKLLVEEKSQIKLRLGCSPDLADALAMTFATVDLPARTTLPNMPVMTGHKAKTDWDPVGDDRDE